MGKIVLWIVVVFAILFALRLYNVAKARSRARSKAAGPAAPESMVRCARCGVFLPRADAQEADDGYRCSDPKCALPRQAPR